MNDEAIIQLFWERSQDGVAALDEKYGRLLHRVIGNILSDTYMKLWSNIPPKRPEHLLAYALRLGRNAALDRLRKQLRLKRDRSADVYYSELEECIPSSFDLSERLLAEETAALLNRYLADLEPETRKMFVRRYFARDSVESLARDFSLSRNAVSARLSRARRGLRNYLEKEGVCV